MPEEQKPAEATGEQKPVEPAPEVKPEQPKTKEEVRAEAIKAVLGDEEPKEEGSEEKPKEEAKPEGEPKPEPEPKPEEKPKEGDEQLDKSWSTIVRRDRELQVERKAIKEQQKDLERLQALEREIEDDPIGFAYKRIGPDGLTRLTARVTAGGKPSAEEEAEILRKKTTKQEKDLEASEEEKREQEIKNRVQDYHTDLKAAAKPETYPLVNLRDAVDDALQVAILHAQQSNGDVLDNAQALQIMEDHLVEEIKRDHKAGNLTERELKDPTVKKILGLDAELEKKPEPEPKSPGKEKGHAPPVKSPKAMSKDEWREHCLREAKMI